MHIQHPGQVFPLLELACPSRKNSTCRGSSWQQSQSLPALWTLGSGEQRKGENHFPQTFPLKDFRGDHHCCTSHLSNPQSFFSFPPFSLPVSQPLWLSGASKWRTKWLQITLTVGYKQECVCSLYVFSCCHCIEGTDEEELLHQNNAPGNLMEEERLLGHTNCQHFPLG